MRAPLAGRTPVVLALAALFAIGGSVALAAIPSSNGAVYVCYTKTTGAMRVVDYPAARCASTERMVALASATVAERHISANFLATGRALTGMVYLEVTAAPNGALRSGIYTQTAVAGSDFWVGNRTQMTIETLRWFTAPSGAPGAEVTGWECVLAKGATDPNPLGTCGHSRIILTDGASKGIPDTFCGGMADVIDPANSQYCPFVSAVSKGDIRIWTGAPSASVDTTVVTKHVDGTIKVHEPNWGGRDWLARFEVRTASGAVQFGYLELYGLTAGQNLGQIHEFSVKSVDYDKTSTGAEGATLHMEECIIIPAAECFTGVDEAWHLSDGSPGTFMDFKDNPWTIKSGTISIYTTSGQDSQ